jgi:tetratricopeptide (TPR) repeat protein
MSGPPQAGDDPPTRDQPPSGPGTARSSGSFRRYLWPAVAGFQFVALVAAGGLAYHFWKQTPATPQPPESGETAPRAAQPSEAEAPKPGGGLAAPRSHDQPAPTAPGRAEEPPAPGTSPPRAETREQPKEPPTLERADGWFREGAFKEALEAYQALADVESIPKAIREVAAYRRALTLERLEDWQPALTAYRDLASRSGDPFVVATAELGQARVWLRLRQPLDAKTLLYKLLLDSGEAQAADSPLLADTRYQLALALTMEAVRAEEPGPLNDALASPSTTDWSFDEALTYVQPTRPAPRRKLPEQIAVSSTSGRVEETLVRGRVRGKSVRALVDELCSKAGLQSRWSDRAAVLAEKRTADLEAEPLPLGDVLQALVDPLGIHWEAGGRTLTLTAAEEATPARAAAYRAAAARRALQAAVASFPGHALTPAASLMFGNLAHHAGDATTALGWYERLVRDAPRSPVDVEAYFNVATTYRRLGDFERARTMYYRVVDRAPGHRLAPLAYLRIGQCYLEEDEPAKAVTPLRRSLSGPTTQAAGAATLGLALVRAGNPAAAAEILRRYRDPLLAEPYRAPANFVSALARFRAAEEALTRRRVAADLLAAALGFRPSPLLGPAGRVELALAFRELDMPAEMAGVLEDALPASRGVLADEMTLMLADYRQASGQQDAAVRSLRAVAAQPGPKAVAAQLRLADLALQLGHPDECLQWCRLVIDANRADAAPVLLRLMGRAFEMKQDHLRAARCFGGEFPDLAALPPAAPPKPSSGS